MMISINFWALIFIAVFHEGWSIKSIGIAVPITSCAAAEAHNDVRRLHRRTNDVNGDENLAAKATTCALFILNTDQENCTTDVSVTQNIALVASQIQRPDIDDVVKKWYSPLKAIHLNDSMVYIKFPIQKIKEAAKIVWTTTTKVGCGAATSVGVTARTVYVCLYSPGTKVDMLRDLDFMEYIRLIKTPAETPEEKFNGICKDEDHENCVKVLRSTESDARHACDNASFARFCKRSCDRCGTDAKE